MASTIGLCACAVVLTACPRVDDVTPKGTTTPPQLAGSAVTSPPTALAALNFRSTFRRVQLDPAVTGTTELCDVSAFDRGGATGTAWLACNNEETGRHQSARVAVAAAPGLLQAVNERSQVRLRIDGPPLPTDDMVIDARTTLVTIVGQLPALQPDPRSGGMKEPAMPTPTVQAFGFGAYVRERHKFVGSKKLCDIARVSEIGRTSASASNPKARILDDQKLPYFARVFCRAESDAAEIVVGSTSLEMIAGLDSELVIEIELGTATRASTEPYPAGQLVRLL
jgi:hypothetical protein